MARYDYLTEDGELVELEFPVCKAPRFLIHAQHGALRRAFVAHYATLRTQSPATYPRDSDAAGCNPEQAQEMYDESVKLGIPTEFNKRTGCAKFESRSHEKRYCEATGLYQRNAGYGDAAPRVVTSERKPRRPNRRLPR